MIVPLKIAFANLHPKHGLFNNFLQNTLLNTLCPPRHMPSGKRTERSAKMMATVSNSSISFSYRAATHS